MTAFVSSPSTADVVHADVAEFSSGSSLDRLSPAEIERNQQIEKYFPLVDKVLAKVRRNLPPHINADDLRGAGVMGLVAAAERFVAAQANTFEGYARLRIRGAMLDELRRIDPCSRRSRIRAKRIQAVTQEVAQAVGRMPTDREVSVRLNITTTELEQWREAAASVRVVSLDVSANPDDPAGSSLHELIPDSEQESVRDAMDREELLQILLHRLEELPALEKKVLALYYHEGMRFCEIARVFDLTESRICQIHKKAVVSLRRYLQSARQS